MNRKKFLLAILEIFLGAVLLFAIFTSRYGSQRFIMNVIEAIALSMGFVGLNKFKQDENRNISHLLLGCAFIWAAICSFLLVIFKKSMWDHFDLLFCGFLILIAAQFPLALYLNHKQKKSSTESTVTDAN
jgi:general stress protein CsbA